MNDSLRDNLLRFVAFWGITLGAGYYAWCWLWARFGETLYIPLGLIAVWLVGRMGAAIWGHSA